MAHKTGKKKAKEAEFSARLWRYPGKGGWVFAPVPEAHAPPVAGAWGRVPVVARVDGKEWPTSVWRDGQRGWLLPVPAKLRGGKDDGDTVVVAIAPDPARPLSR